MGGGDIRLTGSGREMLHSRNICLVDWNDWTVKYVALHSIAFQITYCIILHVFCNHLFILSFD